MDKKRVEEIYELAVVRFEDEKKAKDWLNTLDEDKGKSPVGLMMDGRYDEVEQMLESQ